MNTFSEKQHGQIIVIFAVALVALLAITALAIDGGMIYSDRRYSQSAADASSLAGGGVAASTMDDLGVIYTEFTCTNSGVATARADAIDAAISRAASNNFPTLDGEIADQHGVETLCVNDTANFDKHIDVHTLVSSTTNTSFAQIFTNGEYVNRVEAVVRVRPRTEFAFGNAIVATSPNCQNANEGGVWFDGDSNVVINGGGVFSNACINASGSALSIDVNNGGIGYVTTYTENGSPTVDPAPGQAPAPMPDYGIPEPVCPTTTPKPHTGQGTINPGNYSRIKLTNGDLTLNPGLYCMSGDLNISGGHLIGDGVTIFFVSGSTNFKDDFGVAGNPEIDLYAPTEANLVGNAIPGVVIYTTTSGNVTLLGNGDSTYEGIIYAPHADVDVGGTAGVNPTFNTQIVGKAVKIHGNATININYNNNNPYTWSPLLDVVK